MSELRFCPGCTTISPDRRCQYCDTATEPLQPLPNHRIWLALAAGGAFALLAFTLCFFQ